MPKNMTGGSAHKAHRNSEGSKARNNRCLVDALLDDLANGENITDIYVARVLKRMGSGRMQVFYTNQLGHATEMIVPMRGGLRGKGKGTVWVDTGSLVMVVETGLSGMTHEIVAVFSDTHVARYKKLVPTADDRLFVKGDVTATTAPVEEGFEFDAEASPEEEDVDIDAI
jgi:hypothetical protein